MEGVRLGILNLLQRQPATIEELNTELGLASATVLRHLDILQRRDRLVAYQAVRRKQGRPEHAFSLTEEGHELMPKRYHLLLQRVLQSLDDPDADNFVSGASAARAILAQIAHIMVDEYRSHLRERPDDEPTRLLSLVLEAEQFAPEIETREDGVRITLGNCPSLSVVKENSAVCALGHHLISEILGTFITNTSRINLCTYDAPFRNASNNRSKVITL